MTNNLEFEHFQKVLEEALSQIKEGKGNVRHGQGKMFSEQPWRYITDGVGTGFPLGQAIKKIIEAEKYFALNTNIEPWKKELLGAIVYITMAIMWKEHSTNQNEIN